MKTATRNLTSIFIQGSTSNILQIDSHKNREREREKQEKKERRRRKSGSFFLSITPPAYLFPPFSLFSLSLSSEYYIIIFRWRPTEFQSPASPPLPRRTMSFIPISRLSDPQTSTTLTFLYRPPINLLLLCPMISATRSSSRFLLIPFFPLFFFLFGLSLRWFVVLASFYLLECWNWIVTVSCFRWFFFYEAFELDFQ